MFVWIAVDASEALAQVRQEALRLNKTLGLSKVAFTLPQHISLKISFPVADELFDAAVDAAETFLQRCRPFPVQVRGVERMGSILWLAMEDNPVLTALHDGLDRMMEAQFSAPQHPLDKRFRFHSTLFMDSDAARVAQMQELLRTVDVPGAFVAEKFLIGCSAEGTAGTYRVIREISVG